MEARAFRQVMRKLPTGVTVVTTLAGDGAPVGLTVNAFVSVSLEPPLVLVSLQRSSASRDLILASGSFTVNVLSVAQEALARRFASEPAAGRFDGVGWRSGPGRAPVLEECAAWLACTVEGAQEAGDHTLVIGRVREARVGKAEALVFYGGTFTAPARP